MAIAPQPAMTTRSAPTRPRRARSPQGYVLAEHPPLGWTVAKLVGLLALTAAGVAVAAAIVAGIALFALLNVH